MDSNQIGEIQARRLKEVQAIYHLTDAVNRAHVIEDIYKEALDALECTLGMDRASILLFDPDGVIRFKAWRGLSDSYRNAVEGHSPWKQSETDAQPITVADVVADESLADYRAVIQGEGIRALAFIPLVSDGRLLGKFMVYYNTPHDFTKEEIQISQNIANHVAFALDRRKAEVALQESHALLQAAMDAGKLGAWEWDIARNAITWTDRVYVIHGMEPGSFDGSLEAWRKLVHPDDWETVQSRLQKALARELPYELEFRTVRPNGEIRWVFTRADIVHDSHGKPTRLTGITQDITKRRRAEEALNKQTEKVNQLVEELREADRRKDQFLATLAHELRNPLAPVRNAVQILRMKGQSIPEIDWARDLIDRQMQHMSRLIDDLLDVSRISRNKLELRKDHLDLAKVVSAVVESSRPMFQESEQELIVTLAPETIIVEGDETRLEQIFLNILDNAAKYSDKGAPVRLTVEKQNNQAVISFEDSGIGIPADKLPSIFDMFSQVEDSLSRSRGGLGIGLHLTRRLVEMHRGTIEARSEGAGKGSAFIIRLPIAAMQPASVESNPAQQDAAASARLKVLVVDDIVITAFSFAKMLEMTGNTVKMAHDGEEAILMASEFRPNVALIDVGLPKMNGYDVARHIRQQEWGQAMTLIAVTGWGQEQDKRLAREAGFDRHLVKPLDPQELMNILQELPPG